MLDGLFIGLQTVLTFHNLILVFAGCATGTLIGMLPGLGPITAIALMIPITYGFNPSSGMILLAGVYYGAIFGGSTSSILINAPGVAGTVATAFDGYPIARNGQPGKALAIAAYSSFAGGTLAALLLAGTAPFLADLSLGFQSADYFALMLLGLTLVSAFSSQGEYLKALMMTCFGLMLSTVGTDLSAGVQRFTFGRMDLIDGISFLMLAMATFALSEAIMMVLKPTHANEPAIRLDKTSLHLSLPELRSIVPTISRSSVLGFFVGVLPGAGATIASFLAYGVERNLATSEDRKQFGQGSLKGLAAPEAANNAACTGSFVPLLTLGIPGSGTTAILLGALLAYGIQPGPRLFIDEPEIFWSVIVSMYFGNLMLLVLNLPLIPYIARLLLVPRQYLIPIIMFFSLMGVYLVSFNVFDIQMMVFIAICAVLLRLLEFPMAPLLLGFILGGMLEDNLRRALAVADGQFSFLWDRPTTVVLMSLVVIAILIPMIRALWPKPSR
ncbi:tripartite tricarboxylate transporter permease [Pseudomonadales bacterium]|nr:tripartite tricarboxylate transporter permease [Pseudomonadales bacterium]MDB9942707.1 tripartite tricarboxylate transporter permease [Pseudomonadales bacterium]